MTTPNQSRAETIARIIDPEFWAMHDVFAKSPNRDDMNAGRQRIGLPTDTELVAPSLAKAQSILDLPPLNGGGEGAVWKETEDAPLDGTIIYGCEIGGYRYQPYKPAAGKRPNGAKGRWQKSNGYGGFENSEPPWRWTDLNPTLPQPPALATLNVQGGGDGQ